MASITTPMKTELIIGVLVFVNFREEYIPKGNVIKIDIPTMRGYMTQIKIIVTIYNKNIIK